MWSSSSNRQINYGTSASEMGMGMGMGMVGLRDVFVVAPAPYHHGNHHHHHQHQESSTINFDPHSINASNAAATALGVGVIPLLTASPCLGQQNNVGTGVDEDLFNNSRSCTSRGGTGGAIHFWQQNQNHNLQQQQGSSNNNNSNNDFKKPVLILDHNTNTTSVAAAANLLGGGGGGIIGSSSSASTSTTTCQDCGNQAKKDCSHRRCRTCCKSRGFDCATHVKSTWVPAARRRERQLMASIGGATTAGCSTTQSISSSKKPKLSSQTPTPSHTSTSNNTPPRSFDTAGSSHQDVIFKESLPGQVRAPAVFKCVRVTSVDDGDDEYAYQAMVRIGGHVFKGFLYDQGLQERDGLPDISDLHLGGGGVGGHGHGHGHGHGGGRNGASSSAAHILDQSDVYGVSSVGFLGGGSSTYACHL